MGEAEEEVEEKRKEGRELERRLEEKEDEVRRAQKEVEELVEGRRELEERVRVREERREESLPVREGDREDGDGASVADEPVGGPTGSQVAGEAYFVNFSVVILGTKTFKLEQFNSQFPGLK